MIRLTKEDIESRGWAYNQHGPSAEGPSFKKGKYNCQILCRDSVNTINKDVSPDGNLEIWVTSEKRVGGTIFLGTVNDLHTFDFVCELLNI